MHNTLRETFGNIDIYLFDQLLKGRYDDLNKVLDVGCGSGRNLPYFLRNGYEVFGVDTSPQAVETVKQLSAELAPNNSLENFMVCTAESLPYADASFGLIICSAVLHFARDEQHFYNMLSSIFRVLKSGGYFFSRLASDMGIEELVRPLGNRRYLLPDGTERFLVNEKMLLAYTHEFGELYEPIYIPGERTTLPHRRRMGFIT